MKHHRIVTSLLTAGLIATGLVGCGKKETPTPPPVVKSDAKSPSVTTAGDKKTQPTAPNRREELMQAFKVMQAKNEHSKRVRLLTELSAEQQAKLDKLETALASASSSEDKLAALDDASDVHSSRLAGLVEKALDDKDEEVRLNAMEMLYDYDDASIIPAIAKGINDPSEDVREAAISNLYYVTDDRVKDILDKGLNDESSLVRDSALEMTAEQPDNIKNEIYQNALQNTNEDVVLGVIANLEDAMNHQSMEILITGLKNPNADFRQEVNMAIEFLVDKQFNTYEEAKAWWDANKDKYDDELFEKE